MCRCDAQGRILHNMWSVFEQWLLHSVSICSLRQHLVNILLPKDIHDLLKEKKKHSGSFGVQNKPGWKKKKGRQWGWREHFKQIQWKWREAALQSAQAVGSSIAAINNTFPRASALTPLHLHFLPAILPGWNWGRPKCWLEITQSSQPLSWAVLQCIKLGLTSPFSPAASHPNSHF